MWRRRQHEAAAGDRDMKSSLTEKILDSRLDAKRLTYGGPRPRRLHPLLGMVCGLIIGVGAIVAWAATFEPHGGQEHSLYLFPLWVLALGCWASVGGSFSATAWYG